MDFYVCAVALSVESLPSLGATVNPSPAVGGLYLAVTDGLTAQADGVETRFERLPCAHDWSNDDCMGDSGKTGLYALHVASDQLMSPVVARMGETVVAPLAASPGTWHIRNLRSFQTDYCDDYWNFAYWMTNEPPR
jgi:hypothetical protein